jgi:hypothetical protein
MFSPKNVNCDAKMSEQSFYIEKNADIGLTPVYTETEAK